MEKWRFKDGAEVTIYRIAQGVYCEEYEDDGGFGIDVFPCTVDAFASRRQNFPNRTVKRA